MFGRKKKKEEVKYTTNGIRKIKLSELPPEEQERALADLRKIGDDMVAKFQDIMDKRLETAKARLQDNTDARETEGFSPEADVADTAAKLQSGRLQPKASDNTNVESTLSEHPNAWDEMCAQLNELLNADAAPEADVNAKADNRNDR